MENGKTPLYVAFSTQKGGVGKTTFTDSVGTAPQLAVVTYKVSALNGRYVAVKLRHDAAAEVVCGVTAASSGLYMPAANGWTLAV